MTRSACAAGHFCFRRYRALRGCGVANQPACFWVRSTRMRNKRQERNKNDVVAFRGSCVLVGALKVEHTLLASGQCSTLPASSDFIGHPCDYGFLSHKNALRVCGKESCFDPPSVQAEKGKSVLQSLALQESDKPFSPYSRSQTPNDQAVARFTQTPRSLSQENPQHSFAHPSHTLLPRLATLIRSGGYPPLYSNFSSYIPLPEGRFFDPIPA